MDAAALAVMQEYRDIVLAFGESDEYRHVQAVRCNHSSLIFIQFSVPSFYSVVQPPAIKNPQHDRFILHFMLCHELVEIFSIYSIRVSSVI